MTPGLYSGNLGNLLLDMEEGRGEEVAAGAVESEDFRAGLGMVALTETESGSEGGAWPR